MSPFYTGKPSSLTDISSRRVLSCCGVHSVANLANKNGVTDKTKKLEVENRSTCIIPIFLVTEQMKLWQTSLQKVQAKFLISGCKEMTLLRFGLQKTLNQILSNFVKEGALFKKKKVKKN